MIAYGLLTAIAVALGGPSDGKADLVKKDYARLSGTWRLASAIEDGKQVPRADLERTKLITDGNKFTIEGDIKLGTSASGTFKIDPTQTPKAVDSIQSTGPDAGKTILGIYEIIDDNHKRACWAAPGKPRPSEFTSPPGSGRLLQNWTRQRR